MGIFLKSDISAKLLNEQNNNKLFLSQLSKNQQATIIGYDNIIDTKTKRRLLELGFVKGKKVTLEQISILGDVLLIEINNYLLSLRSSIAKHILINQISNKESV